ncbi:50S ribosomal protein L22 [Buchnera aphidicola]|uniref:50S ribosomal protein L22 n=1 Tax=Buchnera aphidicola TaxID=9 RepID=UPI00346418B9
MEIIAKCKKIRSSPQKIRVIANFIRGKNIKKAFQILSFNAKKSSFLLKKVLFSAISNAEHNYGIDLEKLKIKKIFIDNGPTLKRTMPRAKGKSDKILKRTSHITVILSEK